jgi:hypothetical protein
MSLLPPIYVLSFCYDFSPPLYMILLSLYDFVYTIIVYQLLPLHHKLPQRMATRWKI